MEDQPNVTVKGISLKYGVISALVGIIYFIVLDLSGQAGNQKLGYIGLIFTAVIIYLAHKEFLKNGDGYMSYKQGLGIGTLLSLVGAGINSLFSFVYVQLINPAFLDVIREQQIMEFEKRGMSDAEIDQAMKIAEMFSGPTAMLLFGIFFGTLFGFILSLIISAITKKNNPEFS